MTHGRPGAPGDVAVPRLARTIPAGVVDAGLAALGTFASALYATTQFPAELLGGYALYFIAFITVAVVPTQLLFVPAEVAALSHAGTARLGVVARSLRLGALPTVAFGFIVALTALVSPPELRTADLVAFTATAVVLTALSPVQDHVRRMLHLAGVSWAAATVSAVQLGAVLALIALLTIGGVAEAWVPFGALAGANVVSLAVGLAAVARHRPVAAPVALHLGPLVRSGRWLLVAGAAPAAGGFVASALVAAIAGSAALGYAEAARVVAQPVLVLATGLQAVIGPRSMEAGASRDKASASRHARLFAALVVGASLAYIALVGFDVVWNPAGYLVPKAYVVDGLVAISIVATMAAVIGVPPMSELIGGRREVPLAMVEAVGGSVRGAAGATAGWLDSFAIPWSLAAYAVVRLAGFGWILRPLYRSPRERTP